jgi:hypothetical protein
LNGPEIVKFSYSWPQPIRTTQQVYDKIETLNLQRARRKAERVRRGHHNKNIAYVFTKLAGQAMEFGYEVTDVLRDEVPMEGMRFRPDIGLRIDDRIQCYVEVQLSRLQFTRWSVKFRNYVKLYRKMKKPFRAIFLVDRAGDIATLRRYAREVLEAEGLRFSLFRFMTIDEFRFQTNILTAAVWQSERRKELSSLM